MASTMKTIVVGTPLASKTPSPSVARAVPVVRASSVESRRAVLGGLVAGMSLIASRNANAVSSIGLSDESKQRDNGFDIIYEARDLDLPQSTREGFDQSRGNLETSKARVAEASKRVSGIKEYIDKAYWVRGREELRLQLGTLSFDLDTIINNSGDKKAGKAAKTALFKKINALDYAMRSKDQAKALAALSSTEAAFAAVA